MTQDHVRLHRAVDRLEPAQASALLATLKSMLGEQIAADIPASEAGEGAAKGHRFSFTGIVEGPGDLSERVDEYLGDFRERRS
jgi:hypothetical protein